MTAFITPPTLSGGAIEDRGGWTWSFACDTARVSGWPALNGGATLALSGAADFEQRTPSFNALGIGSARVDKAVVGGTGVRWLATGFPNPGTQDILFRLIFREAAEVTSATYLELSQAAQRITLRRTGTDLELVAALGTYIESVYAVPFDGHDLLLDVIYHSVAGYFEAYLNGINMTPSFATFGSAFTAFGGTASLALLNTVTGSDPAENAELLFAGIALSPTLTLTQHRTDATLLGVSENGLAIEGLDGGFIMGWSPNRYDAVSATIPADPNFGGASARLVVEGDVLFNRTTGAVRREGLRKPRLESAFQLESSLSRVTHDGIQTLADDIHVRLIFRVNTSASAGTVRVAYIESDTAHRFGIDVNALTGDLILHGPSGYDVTLSGAVNLDEWSLLDVSLDRDGGAGPTALFVVQLNGDALSASAHSSLCADIPAESHVVLFDDSAHAGGATNVLIVFFGFASRVMTLDRHRIDALALEVMP